MKQVIIKQGKAVVEEVPAPKIESGRILVRVISSCISIGTEMSGVASSGTPLWKRALQQPENVKKVLSTVKELGISKTRSLVQGKLEAGNPTGYSAAGIVLEVGEGITDIKPGDRVACAGAQCAHHAEIISVPRNLSVLIPENLDFDDASTVTLGAIAMQGVRRAQPTLGETVVVIGLGILGQLAVQLLKANGCRVIGTDLSRERIDLAVEQGLDYGVYLEDGLDVDRVTQITDGLGADAVIITAATPSNEVVSTAFKMCRKKGRVVLVGDVGLNLKRGDFYQKELDFYISTSYGPGRYDNNYEEKGLDYPVSYVRWTENRNMREFLRLIAEGKVKIKPLVNRKYPIDKASAAYDELNSASQKPLMVLLEYPQSNVDQQIVRVVKNNHGFPSKESQINVAVIGAGGFAKGMHLPNLQSLSKQYAIRAVMSRTGHNSLATAKQFGANYASTDYNEILKDEDVNAVIITTRHNMHAQMVLEALSAKKHVLVEKPLTLNKEELSKITSFYANGDKDNKPVLLTGFNRRFSIFARKIKEITDKRVNPMIINYRMNAGYINKDHWVHTEEGGGRNIGEACHIYDLFTSLTNSKVIRVYAQSISPNTDHYAKNDNFIATITFADGTVASLTYTALGNKSYPKEQMEIFVDGKVIELNDYKSLKITGANVNGIDNKQIDKGQRDELIEFANVIKNGGEWPIPLWQQVQAMEIAFEVEEKIIGGNHLCVE